MWYKKRGKIKLVRNITQTENSFKTPTKNRSTKRNLADNLFKLI